MLLAYIYKACKEHQPEVDFFQRKHLFITFPSIYTFTCVGNGVRRDYFEK